MKDPIQLLENFRARFRTSAAIYRAPGRVNLIGEHTDYNDGFVLPAAIEFYCWVAAAARADRKLVIHSENVNETVEANLDSISPAGKNHWASYPLGVAWALQGAGNRLRGANLLISGDVPLGAGLSSSAAIEVAVGFALLHQGGVSIDRTELAKLCQKAENEFVGARCGIMDQFIACHGKASFALLLDCRSLEFQLAQLPAGLRLVICNTMVKHELASGEYNRRRAECEEGVRKLQRVLPGIRALRDVTLAQLETHRALLNATVYSRCRHVVTENDRTMEAIRVLNDRQLSALGRLMAESHRSLRVDYEVSCKELDLMVEIASRQPGVIGARMTGGGFGGCTINLVESGAVDAFKQNVAARYHAQTGLQLEIYVSPAAAGAQQVQISSGEAAQ
ncbi:MAG TPA: galactokinase [Candidatus Acidoferrum sp.]|nr:galactokinase [Candidatus Acidoferrum sp.]